MPPFERCPDHDNLAEEVKTTRLVVARMEEILKSAIKETTSHITAGSKWRIAITIACISLIGSIVGAIVRFSVIDFKVSQHDENIKEMRTQIYDLNYEKGRAVGLQEAKQERGGKDG